MKAKISDALNLLSKVTVKRAINAIRVLSGFHISKVSKNPIPWGKPMSIAIEPTTSCNLRCPECPGGLKNFSRDKGNLNEDFFKQTIDEFADHIFYLTFYFQGEPYIHPKFLDMVKYASQKNIYIATSTNAHFLNDENAKKTIESGLDRLIISIDGTTQEIYQTYRKNGNLEQVLDGAKNILKWKKKLNSKTPHVILQFIVFRQNEHQIEEIKKLGKKLCVDEVKIKTAQIYNYSDGNKRVPTNEKYSRYEKKSDGVFFPRKVTKMASNCWRIWHSCVITWDGIVVPCCFDKDAEHQLGDLKRELFGKIWKSSDYNSFRKLLINKRNEIDICANCTEGTKVWI